MPSPESMLTGMPCSQCPQTTPIALNGIRSIINVVCPKDRKVKVITAKIKKNTMLKTTTAELCVFSASRFCPSYFTVTEGYLAIISGTILLETSANISDAEVLSFVRSASTIISRLPSRWLISTVPRSIS